MRTINYNRVRINTEDDLVIRPIGDLHIGHQNCDEEFIKETLEELNNFSDHRILLMGDLIDCGTKGSVGGSAYEQTLSPNDQLNYLVDMFEPFKDRIDGCVMGNHEYRIYRECGVDITEQFCKQLSIPYFLYSGVVTYSIGINGRERAYNINMIHGKCGGGVENALRSCKAMSNKATADVYLMGHCHHNAHTTRTMKYVDSRNGKLVDGAQHFVLTGHALNYDDSYADQANLEISVKGFPVIIMSGTGKKEIEVN